MQYREFQPNVLLSPYIDSYWMSADFGGKGESYIILPDGCVDIIFTFDKIEEIFYAKIVGTMTSFFEVSYPQSVQMFGIRFKPAGITAFTRVPIDEFTNKNTELTLVDTLFDKSFFETIPEKHSVSEMIAYTDNYFFNKLPLTYRSEKQIIRAVDLIYFSNGQLSPSKIASEVCLCQRHFERKFKSVIGISPKTFAKVIRFKHALRCLRNYPYKDLLSVTIECGYYDHTHLIKDFKTFSGNTPALMR
jgi:AraC-like DNA-binding protein